MMLVSGSATLLASGLVSPSSYCDEKKTTPTITPRLIISNPDTFTTKLKKFTTDGASNLLVISDFDYTLTPYIDLDGLPGQCSHGVLANSLLLAPAVRTQLNELFLTYYPYETCPIKTIEEKIPWMEEWWTRTHEVMIRAKIRHSHLHRMAKESTLTFRTGFDTMFQSLDRADVPVLIFSAGLADIIRELLILKKGPAFLSPNVHVISNLMEFDANGVLVGFQGNLLHSFSKNATAIHGSAFGSQCASRRNVLLIGDSLGDANMAVGLEHDAILKIGFLHHLVDERLEEYSKAFDVVVLGDGSLSPVQLILDMVLDKDPMQATVSTPETELENAQGAFPYK